MSGLPTNSVPLQPMGDLVEELDLIIGTNSLSICMVVAGKEWLVVQTKSKSVTISIAVTRSMG